MATVNKPTDPKQKEADINRKLQFYGIFKAFQLGKVPSNDQIDVALNSFISSRAMSNPSNRLSPEGRELIASFVNAVKHSQRLLLSKNEGNLLQDFIWQTQQFDASTINPPNSPLSKEEAKQHGDTVLQGLRTLGTLLITNGQFRKLLNDATVLMRDMAGDAATTAVTKVRPSEDQLNQIDRPAEDNTWHEAPDLSKEGVRSQLQNVVKRNFGRDDNVATNGGTDGIGGSDAIRSQADDRATAGALSDKAKAAASEENQQKARKMAAEYRRQAREYLGKKVPPERRDQTIWRLKKMILECQQHPDYQRAVTSLLDLAEQYGKHGRSLTTEGAGTVKQTRSAFGAAEADLKTLIERFANGTSTDDLWSSINTMYEDADKDPDLRNWFRSMDNYIRRCLKQSGYIMDDDCNEQWRQLYDRGNYLFRDKYKKHTDHVINELRFLADQFDKDPQNRAFAAAMQKLFNDLGNDANGKPAFKPHLIKDMFEVIIPAALERAAYIPIPRIEYSDQQMDAIVENLVLESDNFMPNVLEIAADNFFRLGRKKIPGKRKNAIDVMVSGVQMDLRDVSFYIKRKKGFPAIKDSGIVHLFLGGDGLSFRMKLSSADEKDRQHFFKVDKVNVDVKHLDVKLVKSKYKLLFGLAKPVLLRVMRPVVQKVAEKQIKEQFNQWDQMLYQIKLEADHALEEARADPQNAPNVYRRYMDAARQQMQQRKQKAKEKAAAQVEKKNVNLAMTREDSVLPEIELPGGISTKATEFKELARRGEKWESPVFSIGSAGKSSNIPRAPRVTRKPHAADSHLHSTTTRGFTDGSADVNRMRNGDFGKPSTAAHTTNPVRI
ncbi:hypothetical protein GGR50DRAFT_682107 [Xylaria sp. CBS 124048]|nr:hypothetical protein GGR50DRAFT_682107 [Xylaria sp. CBS 124048]